MNDRSSTLTRRSSAEQQPRRRRQRRSGAGATSTSARPTIASTSSGSRSSACPVRWSRSVGATRASHTTRNASSGAVRAPPAAVPEPATGPPLRARTTRPAAPPRSPPRRSATRTGIGRTATAASTTPTSTATVLHQNRGRVGGVRSDGTAAKRVAEDVARQPDAQRPPAEAGRDDGAEHQDQEGVGLLVEAGAGLRHRAGGPRHPAVDEVGEQRDGDQHAEQPASGRPRAPPARPRPPGPLGRR